MRKERPKNNIDEVCTDCSLTDEVYPDDGRYCNPKHKGKDWGSHTRSDTIAEDTDYYEENLK